MKHPHLLHGISRATALADRMTGWNPRCMVLYYHLVPETLVDNFRAQLDLLLEMATLVPAHVDETMMNGGTYAAVTIDDCFASALEHAMPLLRDRHIPVTLFVPASRIGHPPDWPPRGEFDPAREQVVSKSALRLFATDALVTIGSHGLRHVDFTQLDEPAARAEFVDSRRRLEAITGRTVRSFSFPFGRATPRLVQWAREAGYTHAFGTEPKPHDGSAANLIGRVRVDPWDSPCDFVRKVRGAYRWLPWALAAKKRFTHDRILQDVA